MKIRVIWIGKEKQPELTRLIDHYIGRIKHYIRIDIDIIKEDKNSKKNPKARSEYECQLILKRLNPGNQVVVLDEKGKNHSSKEFSGFIEKHQQIGTKELVFIIGGPFGIDDKLKKMSNYMLSLSKMTLTHDMARLVLLEQIYRALTIIRGEKYHH